MKKNDSASYLCQPSCGYFFSSGMIVSETVYSNVSHGALYNATSRIIIDGGRKALATAAMAGMIGQNLATPANAVVIGPDTTSTVDVISTFENYYVFGDNAILNVNGSALYTSLFQNGELNINDGGQTSYTLISHMGFENVNNGGYAFSTVPLALSSTGKAGRT